MSEAEENRLGAAAFHQLTFHDPILPDQAINSLVTRVGRRIAAAAAHPSYSWEFVVFDQPDTVNAFALPAGKVGLYSGILPIAQSEAGLAVVVGHEVGHALARHGAERAAHGQLLQLGAAALTIGLGTSPETNLLLQAYGLGAQFGHLLPFSRSQESEADRIGLILMARAGYGPEAAIGLWERMHAQERGGPPEFFSTHPGYGTRIERIRSALPEARSHLTGMPETGETLPPLERVARSPADERALFAAISRLNVLAARDGRMLLAAMEREFQLTDVEIVTRQQELGVSPGGLAVLLVLDAERRVTTSSFVASLRTAENWPAVVRDRGAAPGSVSRRLDQLAATATSAARPR
jgi:hypothetical protein